MYRVQGDVFGLQRRKKIIALARALENHEDLLICDFAQVYHILDYKALPVPLLVTLFSGLGPDSRLARNAADLPVSMRTLLLAAAVDNLTSLVYVHAHKGDKKPGSIVSALLGVGKGKKEDPPGSVKAETFDSAADYEAARRALLEGVNHNAER